jgi:UDP-N-acetylmuramate dehydrogenase
VQNIGAYGQEVKDTIEFVEAYDTKENKITKLSNKDCNFSYRDSIFKSSQKGRYIICFVAFKLSKKAASIPQYKDVINYFIDKDISSPNLREIREAILEIRKNKFVNPSIMPNAGSFFKNPKVPKEIAEKIMLKYPDIKPYPEDTKIFPNPDGTYKLAAGWLIQEAGFKGVELEKVRIDPNHALVLENKGGATQKDLMVLVDKVKAKVFELFEVELEIEPVVV